jgi:hypothetical protein
MKLWIKSCPRCCGDMMEKSDMYGPFISCLQCSHEFPVSQRTDLGSLFSPT